MTDCDLYFLKTAAAGLDAKVMYGFTLYFGHDELPQVDIIYEVPNHQYNQGKITNKMSKVGRLRHKIKAQRAAFERAKQERKRHQATLKSVDEEEADINRRVKEEKEQIIFFAETALKNILQDIQQLLENNATSVQRE